MWRRVLAVAALLAVMLQLTLAQETALPEETSFEQHVGPLLTRYGCNRGCHVPPSKDNVFRLSAFFGQPANDHRAIAFSVDLLNPERSRLLRKATGAEKGSCKPNIPRDSFAYDVLQRWMAQGAKEPNPRSDSPLRLTTSLSSTQLEVGSSREPPGVIAHWPDGSQTDVGAYAAFRCDNDDVATVDVDGSVTAKQPGRTIVRVRYLDQLASLPVLVLPAKKQDGSDGKANEAHDDFTPRSPIDHMAQKQWKELGVRPAGPADDLQFLRRAYVQLIGRLPTVREVRTYLGSPKRRDRDALIDKLMADAEFAAHWSQIWGWWLFGETKLPHVAYAQAADQWLRKAMAEDRGLDTLMRELVSAAGDPRQSAPAGFFVNCTTPKEAAARFARTMLASKFHCAECHSHPQAALGPADFASLTACFAGHKIERSGKDHLVVRNVRATTAEQLPRARRAGMFRPLLDQAGDPRAHLADWLAGEGQMLLARNLANRYWRHFFGRGLMEDEADLRTSVDAALPDVLDHLAKELIDHGFDARHLVRTICKSRLYQSGGRRPDDPAWPDEGGYFTSFVLQRMDMPLLAQLLDQVTETRDIAAEVFDTTMRDAPRWHTHFRFYPTISRAARPSDCPAQEEMTTIASPLHLVSGTGVTKAVSHPRGRIARLLGAGYSDERIIDDLFLAVLTRPPRDDERAKVAEHLAAARAKQPGLFAARRQACEDILWAIINSREFMFIR